MADQRSQTREKIVSLKREFTLKSTGSLNSTRTFGQKCKTEMRRDSKSAERHMSQRSRVRLSELGNKLTTYDTIEKFKQIELERM